MVPASLAALIPPQYRHASQLGDDPDEIERWKEERRRKFPSRASVAARTEEAGAAAARGEYVPSQRRRMGPQRAIYPSSGPAARGPVDTLAPARVAREATAAAEAAAAQGSAATLPAGEDTQGDSMAGDAKAAGGHAAGATVGVDATPAVQQTAPTPTEAALAGAHHAPPSPPTVAEPAAEAPASRAASRTREAGDEDEDSGPDELPATVGAAATLAAASAAEGQEGAAAAAAEAAKAAKAAERQRLREERARGRAKAARARALHAKVSSALRPSLLGSLLSGPAVRETTVVLQCLRRIVEADFFKAPKEAAL